MNKRLFKTNSHLKTVLFLFFLSSFYWNGASGQDGTLSSIIINNAQWDKGLSHVQTYVSKGKANIHKIDDHQSTSSHQPQSHPVAQADAILDYTGHNGKVYFFNGNQYWRFDWGAKAVDGGYPKTISGGWSGLKNYPGKADFSKDLDAAVNRDNKHAYFFKGAYYVKFDIKTNKVLSGYPKTIIGNWADFPTAYTKDIDASYSNYNGTLYFFKNGEYIKYDLNKPGAERLLSGYPKNSGSVYKYANTGFGKNVKAAFRIGTSANVYLWDNNGKYFKYNAKTYKAFSKDYPFAVSHRTWNFKSIPAWLTNTRPLKVTFFNESGYIAKYEVHYNGKKQWSSGDVTLGFKKSTTVPANAKNVRIKGFASNVVAWDEIFNEKVNLGGADYCIKTYGTVFDPKWNTNCNRFNPFSDNKIHVANHTGENVYIGWSTEVRWSIAHITTGMITGLILDNAHNMNANFYKYIAIAAATDIELPKSAYQLFKKASIKIPSQKHKEVVEYSPLGTVKTFFDVVSGPKEYAAKLAIETAQQSDEYKSKYLEFNPILVGANAFGAETLTIMVVNEDLTKFWIINSGTDDSWIIKNDKIVKAKYGTINQTASGGKSNPSIPLSTMTN